MSLRLKSRSKFVPGGFTFSDYRLRWHAPPWSSFDTIVSGLRAARLANPAIVRQFNLATDPAAIADEVDFFNANRCLSSGALDYIDGVEGGASGQAPFLSSGPAALNPIRDLQKSVAGAEVIVEWLASGAEAVKPDLAEERAATCALCPLNGRGPWTRFFTAPAANAIRATLNVKREWKLQTKFDDVLGVCNACDCVNSLKVWMPLEKFLPKMKPEVFEALAPGCWIRKEKQ